MGTWDLGSGWRRLGTLFMTAAVVVATGVGAQAGSSTITGCIANAPGHRGHQPPQAHEMPLKYSPTGTCGHNQTALTWPTEDAFQGVASQQAADVTTLAALKRQQEADQAAIVALQAAVKALQPAPVPVVDQSDVVNSNPGVGTSAMFAGGSRVLAQTFQAGISGSLAQLTLDGRADTSSGPAGVLDIQIETVGRNGLPTGTVIGSGIAAPSAFPDGAFGFATLPLNAPAPIVAGKEYAFVLSSPTSPGSGGPGSAGPGPAPMLPSGYDFMVGASASYPSGSACVSLNGGASWVTGAGSSVEFKTWVIPS